MVYAPLPGRMLKNPFSPKLLKKVQTTHPTDGYPAASPMGWLPGEVRGVLCTYAAALPERAGYPLEVCGPPQVGHRRWAFFSSLLGGDLLDFPGHCLRHRGCLAR